MDDRGLTAAGVAVAAVLVLVVVVAAVIRQRSQRRDSSSPFAHLKLHVAAVNAPPSDCSLVRAMRLVLAQHNASVQPSSSPCCGPTLVSSPSLGVMLSGFYSTHAAAADDDDGALLPSSVTHVINLAHGDLYDADKRKRWHEDRRGVRYLGICARDEPGYDLLALHWDEIRAFAEQFLQTRTSDGGRLLVHCMAGVNRSGCAAVALVSWGDRVDMLQAVRQVCQARSNSALLTNESFQSSLATWWTKQKGSQT